MVFDLMVELDAEDWQLDFPVFFGSGRDGYMKASLEEEKKIYVRCSMALSNISQARN